MLNEFNVYLTQKGLRHSEARLFVAKIFFEFDQHIGIEELYRSVRKQNQKIGIATVYRTLNLLVDSGLALKRNFETGAVTYEKKPLKHHDHLICVICHQVIEFHHDPIEVMQEEVARQHGFVLTSHRMELYGNCRTCSSKLLIVPEEITDRLVS